MDEIFIAIEGLFDLLSEFIYARAFNKEKSLKSRLSYISTYVLTLIIIIVCLTIGGIYLIKDANLIGIILLFFAFLFIMLIYPFLKAFKN